MRRAKRRMRKRPWMCQTQSRHSNMTLAFWTWINIFAIGVHIEGNDVISLEAITVTNLSTRYPRLW